MKYHLQKLILIFLNYYCRDFSKEGEEENNKKITIWIVKTMKLVIEEILKWLKTQILTYINKV